MVRLELKSGSRLPPQLRLLLRQEAGETPEAEMQALLRFRSHPHLERLEQLNPRQKPKRIFIDSMWDWNAAGVKDEWLQAILAKMRECPQHTFMILSKRPKRYGRFQYPENVWLGTSIATSADCYRVNDLRDLNLHNIRFVSIEPIHEHIDFWFSRKALDWIILGAETGHRKGKIRPKRNG